MEITCGRVCGRGVTYETVWAHSWGGSGLSVLSCVIDGAGLFGSGKATERAGAFELGQRYKRAHWVVRGEDEILGNLQRCKGFVNVCESHLHVVERKFWFHHLPATMGQIPLILTSRCSVCRVETVPFRTVLWIKWQTGWTYVVFSLPILMSMSLSSFWLLKLFCDRFLGRSSCEQCSQRFCMFISLCEDFLLEGRFG